MGVGEAEGGGTGFAALAMTERARGFLSESSSSSSSFRGVDREAFFVELSFRSSLLNLPSTLCSLTIL